MTSPPKKRSAAAEDDIRSLLSSSDTATILFPLSEQVKKLLADCAPNGVSSESSLSECLLRVMMQSSEILWKSPFPLNKMVFKCDSNTVVKAVRCIKDFTEYTTLQ